MRARKAKLVSGTNGVTRARPVYRAKPVKGQIDYRKLRKKITDKYPKTLAYLAR